MKIEINDGGCLLIREPGDKRMRRESEVVSAMIRLLNQKGGKFKRIWPYRVGLTSSRLGLADETERIGYWHGNYAVEDAKNAFNRKGKIWFNRFDWI